MTSPTARADHVETSVDGAPNSEIGGFSVNVSVLSLVISATLNQSFPLGEISAPGTRRVNFVWELPWTWKEFFVSVIWPAVDALVNVWSWRTLAKVTPGTARMDL